MCFGRPKLGVLGLADQSHHSSRWRTGRRGCLQWTTCTANTLAMINWYTDPSSAYSSTTWCQELMPWTIWKRFGLESRLFIETMEWQVNTNIWTSSVCLRGNLQPIRNYEERLQKSKGWLGQCLMRGSGITIRISVPTRTSCCISSWTSKWRTFLEITEMSQACLLRPQMLSKMASCQCLCCWRESLIISSRPSCSTSPKRHTSYSIFPCLRSSSIRVCCGVSWERTCKDACLAWRRPVWKDKGLVKRFSKCLPDTGWPCTYASKSTSENKFWQTFSGFSQQLELSLSTHILWYLNYKNTFCLICIACGIWISTYIYNITIRIFINICEPQRRLDQLKLFSGLTLHKLIFGGLYLLSAGETLRERERETFFTLWLDFLYLESSAVAQKQNGFCACMLIERRPKDKIETHGESLS